MTLFFVGIVMVFHPLVLGRYAFLSTRVPTRREPHIVPSGLDRDMNRSSSRNRDKPKRGHTRSDIRETRIRDQRALKHTYKWDNDIDYRVMCSRKGMIRDRFRPLLSHHGVRIRSPDDIPPDPLVLLDGIPRAASHPSD